MKHRTVASLLAIPLLMTGGATRAEGAFEEATAAVAAPTGLQDCGDWRYPVLCRAELRINTASYEWQDYDPDDALKVPPRGNLEIEVSGRDQDGRSFPQERLELGFADRDCRSVLNVERRDEGRVRISARRSDGRCRLELYVPGNLNFAWRIDVEVRRDSVSGYERQEAEAIARALYLGILGREVDSGSFAGAVSEVQRGRLEQQVQAMLRSGEFAQSTASATSAQLLERLYQGLLERRPDSSATRDLLPQLERRNYSDVVLAIIRSAEFEERFLQ